MCFLIIKTNIIILSPNRIIDYLFHALKKTFLGILFIFLIFGSKSKTQGILTKPTYIQKDKNYLNLKDRDKFFGK